MSATGQAQDNELAIHTEQGREWLQWIHANERDPDDAESLSRCLFGCGLEELPLKLMERIWRNVKAAREERERRANPKPGTCWQCGGDTFTDSVECRACHEGYSRRDYERVEKRTFGW